MRYIFCWFIILFSSISSAEEKITVVTESMPPYQQMVNGEVAGKATQIIKQILSCAQIKTDIQLLPWKRAYYSTLNNKNTLIYSIARTPERANKFIWIGTIFDTSVVLFKLKSRTDIVINNFEEIKKYRLGLLRSGFITDYFIRHGFIPGKDFTFYEEESSKIPMLKQGRFDLIDGNPLIIRSSLTSNKMQHYKLQPVYTLKRAQQLYLAANINSDPVLINKIKTCMIKVMSTEQLPVNSSTPANNQ